MSRLADSGKLDLAEVFRRVQAEMTAHLAVSGLFEHAITHGSASEQDWIKLFELFLPKRFTTAPVFVVNSDGSRSRQIDLAVFDNHSSPLMFPHQSGLHVPVESVFAAFEVKSILTSISLRDAGVKAASVRELRSNKARPILAGVLCTTTKWPLTEDSSVLRHFLKALPAHHGIDLGCVLDHASFEFQRRLIVSEPDEALIFFLLRLVHRLDKLGPAPRVDVMRYARGVKSFLK
jgi:hypothetical protein